MNHMNHWYNDIGWVSKFFTDRGYTCVRSKSSSLQVLFVYWCGVQQVTFSWHSEPVTNPLHMHECLRLADAFRAASLASGADPDVTG